MASSAALQKFNQHAPLLAGAAVVVLFGLYLAAEIGGWLELTRAPVETSGDPGMVAGVAPDLQRMQTLFGAAPQMQSQTSTLSSTDLTLHGSFVHADPARSTAIIQRSGGVPELYRPGDPLEEGITLQTVYADRVEILRNGSLETLYFPATRSMASDFTDYSEPPMETLPGEQPDPDAALLQQQMEALRQQMEASAPADTMPTDEQPTEED